MKLYHGSPQNLDILKPQKAKGMDDFENKTCVFLTKTFLHAALYAIGKTPKGKTLFGVSEDKLAILGDSKPKSGYVYGIDVQKPIRGHHGQYASEEEIRPIKKTRVYPKDYARYIVRVKSKEELMETLRANPPGYVAR